MEIDGDWMTHAGLLEGGLGAVRRAPPADGDIVIMREGDEVNLRRYARTRSGRVKLGAESDTGYDRIRIATNGVKL